jgi:putative ABC transport system substrate-binding protein
LQSLIRGCVNAQALAREFSVEQPMTQQPPEKYAAELVALAPDVILAPGNTSLGPLLQATRTVPIVFVTLLDPVGAGFVDSLARAATPPVSSLSNTAWAGNGWNCSSRSRQAWREWGSFGIQAQPQGSGSLPRSSPWRRRSRWSCARLTCARLAKSSALSRRSRALRMVVWSWRRAWVRQIHGDLIITLAARHKLPAVYDDRHFVTGGGLVSYGPDRVDQYRRAAAYVDRIFKGEKPADLPVQAPTKYALVINLKTAKTLGLSVPPHHRASTDRTKSALDCPATITNRLVIARFALDADRCFGNH